MSAIEGDSVSKVTARWKARVARDSSDRAAAFGLATVARLTYDYPAAERGYTRLFNGAHDRYAVYARLGIALGFEMRSFDRDAVSEFDRARNAAHELGDRSLKPKRCCISLGFAAPSTEFLRWRHCSTQSRRSYRIPRRSPGSARQSPGTHASMRGRTAESFAKADSSLALARRAGTLRGQGDAVLLIGQC